MVFVVFFVAFIPFTFHGLLLLLVFRFLCRTHSQSVDVVNLSRLIAFHCGVENRFAESKLADEAVFLIHLIF
jgi:hypothetical protein